MSLIPKNKLKSHLKNFLVELKRRYFCIFETRNIEEIRSDYFNKKWISKEELFRLLEYEEQQFIREYKLLSDQMNDTLSYFNMNSLANYQLLERKYQNKLKT